MKLISVQIELPDDANMAEVIYKVRAIAALVGGQAPQYKASSNESPAFVIKQPQMATVH